MPEHNIKQSELDFLNGELELWREQALISPDQANAIRGLYTVKKSPVSKILLCAGIALVVLGVISFIAANWYDFSINQRVMFIISGYILPLTVSFIFADFYKMPRTSSVFLFFASLAFGGGIFLLGDMFGLNAFGKMILNALAPDGSPALRIVARNTCLWIIGVIPAVIIFKDKLQLLLAQILTLLYLFEIRAAGIFLWLWRGASFDFALLIQPYRAVFLILILWALWAYIKGRAVFNFNVLLTLIFISSRLNLCFGTSLTLLILAVTGVVMLVIFKFNDISTLGFLMTGIFGLALTFPDFWDESPILALNFLNLNASGFAVSTALILVPVFLWQLHKGRYMGGVFFVLLILRYFFDNIFSFMSRAWGFTLVGVVCLAIGIYINKKSKNKNTKNHEQN